MSDKQLPGETTPAATVNDEPERWQPLWWLPCKLSPQVLVARFSVGELLRLQPGSVVGTGWSLGAEIPLYANGQLIGWTELDSVGEHIGARITELV